MSLVTIREIEPQDQAAWRNLWSGYCDFYRTELSPSVTNATWEKIIEPQSAFVGRIAEFDGKIVGFSLAVIHECSWTIAPICYLEDLFVAPHARGRGVGLALIEDIVGLARQNSWALVYWHTEAGNASARRLYDRFGEADSFVRYRLSLD